MTTTFKFDEGPVERLAGVSRQTDRAEGAREQHPRICGIATGPRGGVMTMIATPIDESSMPDARLVREIVQPGLLGLMDGSVSTLAPLFATANLTGSPRAAFFVGLAAAVGAGISMGFAEALSDDGRVSLRGKPWVRGAITGIGTALGGMFHTLPFLIGNLSTAMTAAYVVVVIELVAIACIRYRYMRSALWRTVVQVIVGGAIVFFIGLWLGRYAAGA